MQWASGGRHGHHVESQSMHIYLKNNVAKYPDLITNNAALGFLKSIAPNKNKEQQ